jgi:signal transduction histidine kinase
VSHFAHITSRQLGAPADTVIALSSVWTFCIIAVCAAFLYGLLRRRMLVAKALAGLGVALRADEDPVHKRNALAAALGDSTTELLSRDLDSNAWHDAHGRVVPWPHEPGPGLALTAIGTDAARSDLALIHDEALLDDPELLDGVSSIALDSRRHEQLASDLGKAMSDLEDSRRRIAEAADLERARIERDLHDGAQQRLIALRIRLALAEELLGTGAGVQVLQELGFEAERALDELRSIAHGVYPPLLSDRGLPDALHSVAAQAPMPVHVVAVGITRHRVEIESAVYFTCVEALQNALKHARGATGVWIELTETSSRLSFAIRDDGSGFTSEDHDGRGLQNMHDRIEAVGGYLTIISRPADGTRVTGSVSLL